MRELRRRVLGKGAKSVHTSTPVMCEPVEARLFLSVTKEYVGNSSVLIVHGDATAQTIEISGSAGTPYTYNIYENGVLVDTHVGGLLSLSLQGEGGDDNLAFYNGIGATFRFINGEDGNDTIHGAGLGETLSGGDGDDVIYGSGGDDQIAGDVGNDTLYGDDGNDIMSGSGGNDSITGGNGNDSLDGGAHGDYLIGGIGNDSLTGGSGSDYMYGNEGSDVLDAIDSEIDHGSGGPDGDTINKDAIDDITG